MGNSASQSSNGSIVSPQDLGKLFIPITTLPPQHPLRLRLLQLTSSSTNTNDSNNVSSTRPSFLNTSATPSSSSSLLMPYIVQINDVNDPLVQPLLRCADQFDTKLSSLRKQYTLSSSSPYSLSTEQFWSLYFTTAIRIIQEYNQTNIMIDDDNFSTNTTTPNGTHSSKKKMEDSEDEEAILLCQIEEVFVYKVPPRPSAAGWKAQEWPGGLDNPFVIGYLRITGHGKNVVVTVWKKTSSNPSNPSNPSSSSSSTTCIPNRNYNIAQQPLLLGHTIVLSCKFTIHDERGISFFIEPVIDSSRYFVLRMIAKDNRVAFAGIGFRERHSAFEMKESITHYIAQYDRQQRSLQTVLVSKEEEDKNTKIEPRNIETETDPQPGTTKNTDGSTTTNIPTNTSTSFTTATKVPLLTPPPRTTNIPLTNTSSLNFDTMPVPSVVSPSSTARSTTTVPSTTITRTNEEVSSTTTTGTHSSSNEENGPDEEDEFGEFVSH